MRVFLIVALAIIIVKFVVNLVRYSQCKWYFKKYQIYLVHPTFQFNEYEPTIINLFKSASLIEPYVPYAEPIGFGRLRTGQVSVFSNLTVTRIDVVGLVYKTFHKAIGVYRYRMLESFSPIYWLQAILFLPRLTLVYLGTSPDQVIVKLFQLVYWVLGIILGFLLSIYRTEIEVFVRDLVDKFFG